MTTTAPSPVPTVATSARERMSVWRPGMPVAGRQFVEIGDLTTEFGGLIPDVTLSYRSYGTLNALRDNAVLVEHALTGDSYLTGQPVPGQPSPGWWADVIGPGRPLDPARWFILVPNVLGGCQGSTGPGSLAPDGQAWGSRFPRITVRDQVLAEQRLADALGIESFAAIIGGSMGGMRTLEWLVSAPERARSGLVLASTAASSAEQIGIQTSQILAIEADGQWNNGDYYHLADGAGPVRGLGLARRLAHLTYRSSLELELRFGRRRQEGENPYQDTAHPTQAGNRFAIQSYLDHHAHKIEQRFDPGSYVRLTDSMNTHDVGRDRGGVHAALQRVTAPVVVAGVDSDRLYPIYQQQEIVAGLRHTTGLQVIESVYGHDGFLVEQEEVAKLVTQTLDLVK